LTGDGRFLEELAWLVAPGGKTYFARGRAGELASATYRLVAGVQRAAGWDSLRVLRNRIFTTTAPNELDARLVQVAAKRIDFLADADALELGGGAVDLSGTVIGDSAADRSLELGGKGTVLSPSDAAAAVARLAASVPLEPDRFTSSRPIGALAVDAEGRLLGAAVNTNVVYRLLHAELNLVFNDLMSGGLPRGSVVYTSLSPCRMCAALLARVAEDGARLRVVATAQDPGRFGRQDAIATEIWGAAAWSVPSGPGPR
jgi:tRNA(Arg) A34 adenosine deaminase TadA